MNMKARNNSSSPDRSAGQDQGLPCFVLARRTCTLGKSLIGVVAVGALTACGGGSSTGPSSMVGITLVSANPSPGSTITVMPVEGGVPRAEVSMVFSVVSDQDIKNPVGVVELTAGGRVCGDDQPGIFGLPDIKRGQPQTLTVQSLGWYKLACPLPTTTSTVRVTVSEFSLCFSNPCAAVPTFTRDLAIGYTFVAP